MKIITQAGIANTTYSANRAIKWLIIHYSASTSSKKGCASSLCSWFANTNAGGSADFAVDDETFYQYNGDIKNRYCWAIGGSKYTTMSTSLGGKYYNQAGNANSISIELCSNKVNAKSLSVEDNDWYLTEATINNGVELAAYLMKQYNIDIDHVIMHHMRTGKWCPQPWTKNENALSGWYDFLKRVKKAYDGTEYSTPVAEDIYRVRASWEDSKSQLFAGTLDGAKNVVDDNPGYHVYDGTGKLVYEGMKADNNTTAVTTEAKGVPVSKEDYLAKVSAVAVDLAKIYHILPSVVIAQTILENGWGLAADAMELTKVSNILGMKTELINSTWSKYSVWKGKSIVKRTPEYYNGVLTYIDDSFRVYDDYRNCIEDYLNFLLHVRNNNGLKYADIQNMTNPKDVITIISQRGYSTSPSYVTSVMRIINENDLTKYDVEAGMVNDTSTAGKTASDLSDKYRVGKSIKDGVVQGQIGAFSVLDNAKKLAASNGLKVYDITTGKVVFPTETAPTTAVSYYRIGTAWENGACVNQKGAYTNLSNAKNKCDGLYGYKIFDENGKIVYTSQLKKSQVPSKASEEAIAIANDNRHGYNNSPSGRNGNPDYACSSFVSAAYINVGVNLGTEAGKIYTADMKSIYISHGFKDVTSKVNFKTGSGFQIGDVLVKPGAHTEIYVGNGKVAGARGNAGALRAENGQAGDQTGGEIAVSAYYNFPWTICLRYDTSGSDTNQTTTVQYRVQCGVYSNEKNCDVMVKKMQSYGFDALKVKSGNSYIAQAGVFGVKANATALANRLKAKGLPVLIVDV